MSKIYPVDLTRLVSGARLDCPHYLYGDLVEVGEKRGGVDASNTRGAGTNVGMHVEGVLGEGLVRYHLGIEDLPECLTTYSTEPDLLIEPQTFAGETYSGIEVKKGGAYEGKKKLRTDCIYVVVSRSRPFMITHVCLGEEILVHHTEPKGHSGWRLNSKGRPSQEDNWEIPNTDPFNRGSINR